MIELIDHRWTWNISPVRKGEFTATFPDSASLRLCKNATGLTLPSSKINIVVADCIKDPFPVDDLKPM